MKETIHEWVVDTISGNMTCWHFGVCTISERTSKEEQFKHN